MSTSPEIITCSYKGPEHRDACLSIWYRASLAGHPFLEPETIASDLPLVRDVYFPRAAVTIAEIAGVTAGFIALIDKHIGGLFVDPDRHRLGIGQALLGAAEDQVGQLTVEVYEQNTRAIAFYEACGFKRTGWKAKDDQGRPHRLIAMARVASIGSTQQR